MEDTTLQYLKDYTYDILGCCQLVHHELGPWLNEYMYQEALKIAFEYKNIPYQKEYYFQVEFLGQTIPHKHFVDFIVKDSICLECKAVKGLCDEHRQQLWNYMRLAHKEIGILYNFAPYKDQCEKYFLDTDSKKILAF